MYNYILYILYTYILLILLEFLLKVCSYGFAMYNYLLLHIAFTKKQNILI